MKAGDLVRLSEDHGSPTFALGNLDQHSVGIMVPDGSLAVILKVVESDEDHNEKTFHVMVGGFVGWVYPEDCEAVDD